jgi:hypothetical protein
MFVRATMLVNAHTCNGRFVLACIRKMLHTFRLDMLCRTQCVDDMCLQCLARQASRESVVLVNVVIAAVRDVAG